MELNLYGRILNKILYVLVVGDSDISIITTLSFITHFKTDI